MPTFDPRCCIFCGDILFETDERGPIITMKDGASYHFLCGLESLDQRLGMGHPGLIQRVVEQDPPHEEDD